MLHAYCDESYSGNIKTTPFYVVAGFIGVQKQWDLFDSLWRDTMRELGIEDLGCHAAKCESGSKAYKRFSRAQREEIQYRLIVDIAACKLYGAVTVIDMRAYGRVRAALSDCLREEVRQYNEPHVLAVRQCVQQMCQVTRDATDEPISFVVDRNEAFGKRARAWYSMSVDNPEETVRGRLGAYSEDDRLHALGLQAADLLAWASFRQTIGVPCWQWAKLRPAIRLSEFVTGAAFWDQLRVNFEEVAGQKRVAAVDRPLSD